MHGWAGARGGKGIITVEHAWSIPSSFVSRCMCANELSCVPVSGGWAAVKIHVVLYLVRYVFSA